MPQYGPRGYIKPFLNKDWLLHALLLLLCLIPVLASIGLITNGELTTLRIGDQFYSVGIPCFFYSMTGYNCPVCGMTRSFIYMSDINIEAAWSINKAGALLYLFCILQIPYRLILIFKRDIPVQRQIVFVEAAFLVAIGVIAMDQFVGQFF